MDALPYTGCKRLAELLLKKPDLKMPLLVKMAPTKQEDSTWSLEDARNSAIVYKPSDIPNASGPSIADPTQWRDHGKPYQLVS